MTQPDLARLEGLLAKAAIAAPIACRTSKDGERAIIFDANHDSLFRPLDPEASYAEAEVDHAELIVAAVNSLSALLARVRELETVVETIANHRPISPPLAHVVQMQRIARAALTLKENPDANR